MLRLKNLSNKFQKRTLRVEYGQTQATPYAATLDASLRNADGSFTTFGAAFKLKNGLIPGTVMIRGAASGETVRPSTGRTTGAAEQPFGLLANFVGGDLDELGDENAVGVWRGIGSVYSVLAPAFDDTGLDAALTAATATGQVVPLYSLADGRLGVVGSPTATQVVVAHVIERVSAQRVVIDLRV